MNALHLLKLATEAFPITEALPGSKGPPRHGLTVAEDGRLCLNLFRLGTFQPVFFDAADLERDAADLITEIKEAVEKHMTNERPKKLWIPDPVSAEWAGGMKPERLAELERKVQDAEDRNRETADGTRMITFNPATVRELLDEVRRLRRLSEGRGAPATGTRGRLDARTSGFRATCLQPGAAPHRPHEADLPDRNDKTLTLVRELGFDSVTCEHGAIEKVFFLGLNGREEGAHATEEAVLNFIEHCEHQAAVARDYLVNGRNNKTHEWTKTAVANTVALDDLRDELERIQPSGRG